MKKIFIPILFVLFSIPSSGFAGLDEEVIPTEDGSCSIHYLSNRTKYNWTIQVNPHSCQDGWVEGFADVQLYSPRKEKTETLSGFFKEGYWLGAFPNAGKIIERSSPAEHIQTLSFLLGEDKEANITYIGQLRSTQPENRTYGAFQGCPDFRVLVVAPDISIFQNPAFQDKIVEQGTFYAKSHCQNPEILALFGATKAVQPDISFHMQVDLETQERAILPIEEKSDSPSLNKPTEIREEKTDVLLSVIPKMDLPTVSYLPVSSEKNPTHQKEKKKKDILNHLQILSHASDTPVKGRTVVHIQQILLDGTGITDLPEEIQLLYYPNLKTGWAVIEGILKENKMQVSDVQFCKEEWCTDVP